jgi:hypothetical protein
MSTHKRLASHRDTAFHRPRFECYACHDTGLLVNPDGLLRHYLADYDTLPDGRASGGHDLALVCWCTAAYGSRGLDGQVTRGGFREDSGDVRQVQTSSGTQAVGASLSKDVTRELHQQRRTRWTETEQLMSEARQAGESPWFIAEVKASLQKVAAGTQRGSGRLQSLGDILGSGADSAAA